MPIYLERVRHCGVISWFLLSDALTCLHYEHAKLPGVFHARLIFLSQYV